MQQTPPTPIGRMSAGSMSAGRLPETARSLDSRVMKYRILAAIAVTALAGSSSQGFAQSTNTDAILQRLEAKVDALAKENAELRERVPFVCFDLGVQRRSAMDNACRRGRRRLCPPHRRRAILAGRRQFLAHWHVSIARS